MWPQKFPTRELRSRAESVCGDDAEQGDLPAATGMVSCGRVRRACRRSGQQDAAGVRSHPGGRGERRETSTQPSYDRRQEQRERGTPEERQVTELARGLCVGETIPFNE